MRHDAPLILPENMLLKSENFMYFVVTMHRLPKQHALCTQATYTTKALALQRAKYHRYHITNSLYDNVMSARIAARDLAAMLWMPHVMSRLCMLHVMLMLWMRLLGLRVGRHDAETKYYVSYM